MEFLPIIAIAVIFWLLMIRPASRRQKQLSQMQSGLAVGDRVMLSSGIFGTVQSTEAGDRLHIEVAPGTVLEVARGAIANVLSEPVVETDALEAEVEAPAEVEHPDAAGRTDEGPNLRKES